MTADAVALALSGQPVPAHSFDEWRAAARALIVRHVPPESVQWSLQDGGGDLLSGMPPLLVAQTEVAVGSGVAGIEAKAVAVEVAVAGEVAVPEVAVEGEVETEVASEVASEVSVAAQIPDEASDPPPQPHPRPLAKPASQAVLRKAPELRISRQLMELLQSAACYRAHDRWAFLYRVLWRWHHGAHDVISMADEDGARLHHMAKAVRHEEHDMHAYLRFRERPADAGAPRFVAWFEPAHDVLPQVSRHFAKRMGRISWMIATPEATVLWDGTTLHEGDALAKSAADFDDAGEALWLTYYRSIFNPARLNADIMHGHIRQRFWKNLPEAAVVPHMVSQAAAGARKVGQLDTVGRRVGTTIPIAPGKAVPERQQPTSLDDCRRCELWQHATQAVAGQGARSARIMLVGEQPGDQEDLSGKPFVGPAGELLDRAMLQAEVDRRQVYVTNAVKHFKWEPRGKRRLHKTPAQKEVLACHYWLETELKEVAPQVLVALGSTALKSILQSGSVTMKDYIDQPFRHEGRWVVATYHPAYALRVPDAASRQAAFTAIVDALKTAQRLANDEPPPAAV